MPPKRLTLDMADITDTNTSTDDHTEDALMPPPATPKRRRTSETHNTHTPNTHTPNTISPPSLFFAIPLPPPYNPSSPTDANNHPPSDSQFAAFVASLITTLPAPTQALYSRAICNLSPENTPQLTEEMRASLTSAVTGFVVHSPTTDWEGHFLTRLAGGEVPWRELVSWADTITAALRAFSAVGGSPAPSWPSSPRSVGSPVPTQSPDPGTPIPLTPVALAHPRYRNHSGRSATIRTSTLMRDTNACILTSLVGPSLEVAHIIPFSVRAAKADTFWGFLGIFLGIQGAERIRRTTLQLATGEDPAQQRQAGAMGELMNCLTLAAHAHRHLDAGAIEILPVLGSGNWSGDYDPSIVSSYDIRLSFPGQALTPFYRCVYSDGMPPQLLSSTQLVSGNIVTLTTPDPAQWPLPHPLLLQLHALCGRVKRLRAAAGWPVLPYGDGSEEGLFWGDDVEVWDQEEEGIKPRWVGEIAEPVGLDRELQPEPGMAGHKGMKRKLGADRAEGQDERVEWPREVEVVLGEMGMREQERWTLLKGMGRGRE